MATSKTSKCASELGRKGGLKAKAMKVGIHSPKYKKKVAAAKKKKAATKKAAKPKKVATRKATATKKKTATRKPAARKTVKKKK